MYEGDMKKGGGGGSHSAKGSSLKTGLSRQEGMGDYAKGDAKDTNLPMGGSYHDMSVKKGGKSFKIC